MKKILLSAALMVAAVSFASAQQWFVGGSVGFSHEQSGIDIYDDVWNVNVLGSNVETTSYSIMPKFGYIFNESWTVGLGLGYSHSEVKDAWKSNMFVANPYARYTAWQLGRFSLAFQGNLMGAMGDLKPDGGVKAKVKSVGISVVPVVQFDLTCNVMLESRFNFANAGWDWTMYDFGGLKRKSTGFGLGVDADDAFTTGDIEVGFIVKF